MTECEEKGYHIFAPAEIGICIGECRLVHFFCQRCQQQIDSRRFEDCPRETQALVVELVTTEWEEVPNGREPA